MRASPPGFTHGSAVFLLLPLMLGLMLGACRSHQLRAAPKIIFSRVPPADVGGPEKLDTIEGRVTRVKPGQQIVLYARSADLWWVQPFTDSPFTTIQDDSTWESQTHLGTDYAALLVDPGFSPPATSEQLPSAGAGVVAVAVSKGEGPGPPMTPPKILHFSGYDWDVRAVAGDRAGSPTSFDPANAWTDPSGALHLHIGGTPGKWTGAEVKLTRSLGFGTYLFVVRDTSHLEPSDVLTLLTWDGIDSDRNQRELDIEISRWGHAKNENAHYVVQPYYVPGNLIRFRVPGGVLTDSFRWEPGKALFSTVAGSDGGSSGRIINRHLFTFGVPAPGGEFVHISLYPFAKGEIPIKHEAEVVINKFEFLP